MRAIDTSKVVQVAVVVNDVEEKARAWSAFLGVDEPAYSLTTHPYAETGTRTTGVRPKPG